MRTAITWMTAAALTACTPAGSSDADEPDINPRLGRDAQRTQDDGIPDDGGPGEDMPPPADVGSDVWKPDPDTGPDAATSDGPAADPDAPPDMAPPECAGDGECDDRNPCTLDMCVGEVCTSDPLDGCCLRDDECGEGGVCLRALRECAVPSPPAAVVITELLPDPDAVGDPEGEWIEVANVSAAAIVLNGWTLHGDEDEQHPLVFADRTVLPAGGVWLLARGDDPQANGGVVPDYVYDGVTLSNGADRVALTDALGNVVDELVYDREFPLETGASLSLDAARRDPAANDHPLSWCAGAAPWGEGTDRGTPGEDNPPCPDREVDWCRLQFPLDAQSEAGDALLAYGRVFEAGVTDRSDATDPDEALTAQLGYGPDGTDPGGDDWEWTAAEPNPGWNAADAEEPGNDEYQGALVVREPGLYDFAYRFSRDGGALWVYCDRAAGPGADGAEDGYQIERAGQLTVVPGPPHPAAGEVVVSELLFDVRDPLSDADAEWIELRNLSDERRRLDGCTLGDAGGAGVLVGVTLDPGGYALLARSDDPGENGGLTPDGTFRFSLNNGGDSVSLRCGEVEVDTYAFDASIGGDGVAIQRDDEGAWCVASAVYFEAPDAPETAHRGTPGEANRRCPPPPMVDFCALQFPLDIEARAGEQLQIFGVVYEPGLTDLSPRSDPTDRIEGQAGAGPAGTDPAADDGWAWRGGAPNPEWDGVEAGQPNNDEYMAAFGVALEGDYDLAWRFRLDGGAWTYCDRDPGSEDGYAPEDAGHLTATPPPPPPPEGAIRFTEVMYDPHDQLAEGDAEWFELTSVADAEHSLGGCVVGDAGGGEVVLEPLTLGPGQVALLARDANPEVNGGLRPVQVFGFGLGNDGDTLTLTCGDVEVARLQYGVRGAWPLARQYAISLDPGAADPDDAGAWCRVRTTYFPGHHGTPGAPNPPCDVPVDSCRFQHPLEAARAPGVEVTAYGRVFQGGVTDRTPQVDVDPLLRLEAGYGPAQSDPADDGWTWLAAAPNAGWDGAAAGLPDHDEYQRGLAIDDEGAYALAYRASADDGRTWTVCDGGGGLEVRAPIDPCDEIACDAPPEPACTEETTLRFHDAPGACEVAGDEASCVYASRDVDCAPDICFAGRCAPEGAQDNPRAAGEVVVTEVMYDPHDPLADETAEWFELYNAADRVVDLVGCTVDAGGPRTVLGTLRADPGGRLVLARSSDADANGGLAPDHLFDFPLGNAGATLTLSCRDLVVDQVAYDDGGAFPDARAHSIALDPGATDAATNDAGGNWCRARALYAAANHGTPGEANPPCDRAVGWCRLQFPQGIDAEVDQRVTVYGRFYAEGLTDRSTGNDPDPLVRGELGYGADGGDPTADDWAWTAGAYNPGFDGVEFGEPDNDELQAELTVPSPREGGYDYAYRISVDDGRSWLYCDVDGSDNGYAPEAAGRMDPVPAPCNPNPCVAPPAPRCGDEGTLIVSAGLGRCTPVDGHGACHYDSVEVGCACAGDTCPGLPDRPAAHGDVLFTELMYDPHFALADGAAEWIELHNPTAEAWSLVGCRLSDGADNALLLGDLRLDAGGYALLARSDDAARNGGLDPDALFDFALGNDGDAVRLHCSGVLVDAVAYDDGPEFPDARAASLSLHPDALDPVANDDGANWCLGAAAYFVDDEGDNLGTPGAANPECVDEGGR